MSDPIVLELTASEPLSLEEEYQMQVNWSRDEDKRTFILVDRELLAADGSNDEDIMEDGFVLKSDLIINKRRNSSCVHSTTNTPTVDETTCDCLRIAIQALNSVSATVGDINLFLHESLQYSDNEDEDANEDNAVIQRPFTAEVEVMVAEQMRRRRGIGSNALKLLMQYGQEELQVKRFIAKVLDDNEPSIALFKRLDYDVKCLVECFNEIHFQYLVENHEQDGQN